MEKFNPEKEMGEISIWNEQMFEAIKNKDIIKILNLHTDIMKRIGRLIGTINALSIQLDSYED